jgi:hypothetical protein
LGLYWGVGRSGSIRSHKTAGRSALAMKAPFEVTGMFQATTMKIAVGGFFTGSKIRERPPEPYIAGTGVHGNADHGKS